MRASSKVATGRIGRTVAESSPAWEELARPAPTAPNVVLVILDDTGWADLGCYGSEIATPTIDRLASAGVRFNNFHVTPLCSPTRACLLTGRNHHSVGMRFLAVADTGFPNSRGCVSPDVETLPQQLRDHGYGTYLAGKWHLAPQSEISPVGPYRNWPLAKGFERFYGYLGGASDQHLPELFQDNTPVSVPEGEGYHLSADLVDRGIGFIRDHIAFRPADPFFLQLSFGATHAPFQAPEEYIARYDGVYDCGWEEVRSSRLVRQKEIAVVPAGTRMAERDSDVPLWDELNADQRSIAAQIQQAYAGFLEHTDAQLGRLVDWLSEVGQLDNTLLLVLSDNGAAGDGGLIGSTNVTATYSNSTLPISHEVEHQKFAGDRDHPAHYAQGWAMAGNTPFRLYKQFVDLGGVRSPLVIHWPNGVTDRGQIRGQFAHAIDIPATILDFAGMLGAQRADDTPGLDGASLRAVLTDAAAASPRQTQYFEMLGHRALWHEGWMAVTRHIPSRPYETDTWRLYNTNVDFAEANDLATEHPELLRQLEELWWDEAETFGVLPLDDRPLRDVLNANAPGARGVTTRLVLRPGQSHLNFTTRLTGTDRDMALVARLRNRRRGDEGVLIASGCSYGGYVLYVLDDKLHFEHHFLGERAALASDRVLPDGDVTLGVRLTNAGQRAAVATMHIGGDIVGRCDIPRTALNLAMYGLDVGRDPGSPVSPAYAARGEFAFPNDVLREVTITFGSADVDNNELSDLLEAEQ